VNDKRLDEVTGERKRFSSAILPPRCRKSPKLNEVLPLLYPHGLPHGAPASLLDDLAAALAQL
jgi:putative transposase